MVLTFRVIGLRGVELLQTCCMTIFDVGYSGGVSSVFRIDKLCCKRFRGAGGIAGDLRVLGLNGVGVVCCGPDWSVCGLCTVVFALCFDLGVGFLFWVLLAGFADGW